MPDRRHRALVAPGTHEIMEDAPTLAEALRKAAPRIASHMNEDHSASLRAYLGHYGGLPEGEYDVWMTGLNARGFILEYRVRDGTLTAPKHEMVAPFPRPITSASQVRAHLDFTHTALRVHCICAVCCASTARRAHRASGEDVRRRDAHRGL